MIFISYFFDMIKVMNKLENYNKPEIVAEIGVNHNGSLVQAKKLILMAKKSGADYVKFQLYDVDKLILKKTGLANYQKKNDFNLSNQYDLLKKLQLGKNSYLELIKFSKENNIKFMSSVFDVQSLKFLKKNNFKYLKIPSGELKNFELLDEINNSFSKIILSTGMAAYSDIKKSYLFLVNKKKINKKKITILHCISDYPVKIHDMNLNSIKYLKNVFDCSIGLSDHSMGIKASVAASIIGISIIEKHFTNNVNLSGPDHKSSLTPKEFKNLVHEIDLNHIMLGQYSKKISSLEKKNIFFVQKSIVAKSKILKGQYFTKHNITTKRPLNGIISSKWFEVIGKKAIKTFNPDDLIIIK